MFFKHGKSYSSEYKAWISMKYRTSDRSKGNFRKYYYSRGIKTCKRWLGPNGFSYFLKDLGPKPHKNFSLERKNNDLGYTPKNCIWASPQVQQNNTRNTIFLTFNGETLSVAQWSKRIGIKANTIKSRIKRGRPINEILSPSLFPFLHSAS
jgi:hypothetical protein